MGVRRESRTAGRLRETFENGRWRKLWKTKRMR